jgi:hypothetical protein
MVGGEAGGIDLSKVFAGRYLRSPVFDWLDANYDEIVRLNKGRHIAWQPVAEHLAAIKIFDGSGKPPSARRIANIWLAIKRMRTADLLAEEEPRAPKMAFAVAEASRAEPEEGRSTDNPVNLPSRRRAQAAEERLAVPEEEVLAMLADVRDGMHHDDRHFGGQRPPNPFRDQLASKQSGAPALPSPEEK